MNINSENHSPVTPKDADSRERLITSTQQLLWERGYIGVSPSAIQKKSGVGQGSMYHHFKGKPELALAAIVRSAAEMQATSESRFSSHGTAIERISAFLHSKRDVLRGCQAGRLVQDPDVIASAELRQPLDDLFHFVRMRLISIIQSGVDNGEFDAALSPENTAEMIAASVQGGYVLARAADSIEPFNRMVAAVIDMLEMRATIAAQNRTR